MENARDDVPFLRAEIDLGESIGHSARLKFGDLIFDFVDALYGFLLDLAQGRELILARDSVRLSASDGEFQSIGDGIGRFVGRGRRAVLIEESVEFRR